jgi:isopenicillin-N epimerase
MTTSRRSFLSAAATLAAAPAFNASAFRRLTRAREIAGARHPGDLTEDEAFWFEIQRAFEVDRTWVNLNNGGVSPAPSLVIEQLIRDIHYSNEIPVDHMWRHLQPRMETVRRELAQEFGCDTEEMAIVRNASEANETMIFGIDLARGDEVIVSTQNYPRMLNAWEQRVRRDGIVLKKVKFAVPVQKPDDVVQAFAAAITPRTKVIEITHITNLTGQILPVREIVMMARAKGIQVFVDGAHAFAHFPFTRDDLGVDYYGTSLHKWLYAPIGTGFLYVRKEKQRALWPLMAAMASQDNDIRKFEEIGTHPQANFNAIAAALVFHRGIGADRKIARMRWLRDRWAKRLLAEGNGRVKVFTPLDSPWGGGIGFFNVDGLDPVKLGGWLYAKHHIVTTPIVHADEFAGIRVTPNVYTTPREIDVFADKVLLAVKQGIA